MSGASRALGGVIEAAVIDATNKRDGAITVGQVARLAQCTKPTARRYLKLLAEHSCVAYRHSGAGRGQLEYWWIGEFQS